MNTIITSCACGCGTPLTRFSGTKRLLPFLRGHKTGRPNPLIPCACGCGETLAKFDGRGRERRMIPLHQGKLQPTKRIQKTCDNCGCRFESPVWYASKLEHHFCKSACRVEWIRKTGAMRGSNNPSYNTITVPCTACGNSVSKAASLIRRRNGRVFCKDCVHLCRKGRPGFYVGYPKAFSYSLRKKVRARDGQTCQYCGKQRDRDQTGTLHVHHIDDDKNNNAIINLIALCASCHGRTHFGIPQWIAFFQQLQAKRFPV